MLDTLYKENQEENQEENQVEDEEKENCKLFDNMKISNNLNKNNNLNDINAFVLYGNENIYMNHISNMMIKKMFNNRNIITKKTIFAYTNNLDTKIEVEYEYSDYHFEFEYSEKHIAFIKSIIQNKNISSRSFVFIIKNMDNTTKVSQFPLKKLMDANNAIYIFLTKSLNKIENAILSRSTIINTHFPILNIYKIFNSIIKKPIEFIEFEKHFNNAHNSIVVLLIQNENGFVQLRILQNLDNLINKIQKEKNMFEIIILIREFIYKAYHITFPLQYISKFVINKFIKEKYISDIVSLCAECDNDLNNTNKEILIYEKFFINLVKIIKN